MRDVPRIQEEGYEERVPAHYNLFSIYFGSRPLDGWWKGRRSHDHARKPANGKSLLFIVRCEIFSGQPERALVLSRFSTIMVVTHSSLTLMMCANH